MTLLTPEMKEKLAALANATPDAAAVTTVTADAITATTVAGAPAEGAVTEIAVSPVEAAALAEEGLTLVMGAPKDQLIAGDMVEVVPDDSTLREMNMAGYPQSHAHVWVKATVTDVYLDDDNKVRWIDVAIPVAPAGNYGGHVVVSGNNQPTLIRMTGVRNHTAALEGQTTRLYRA